MNNKYGFLNDEEFGKCEVIERAHLIPRKNSPQFFR